MRKLFLLLLAAGLLAAAGAAAATARTASTAATTITITKNGYKPTSVSITVGDTVVFANDDTASHTVDFKSTTGMHCSVAVPLVIAAGQSASCTFSSTGNFRFSDATGKGKNFRGTITVGKPLVSSLTVTPKAVVYGGKSTLAGKLASGLAGQSVQVSEQACGATSSTPLTTVTTTTGGAFTFQAQPLKRTAYTLKNKNLTTTAAVGVKPRLRLSKVRSHRYRLRVFAAESFAGKVAAFQRYRKSSKRWQRVKRVTLKTDTSGKAPTVVSSVRFRSKVRAKVRVVLPQKQVGVCYLPGRSNVVRGG
jgi:plastocyanin